MVARPHEPVDPADDYDPKTDQKIDQLQRELHADFYDERKALEALQAKEEALEAKLQELKRVKEKIVHPNPQ